MDAPADEWSDVDLLVVTEDPDQILLHDDWLKEVGEGLLLAFVEQTEGPTGGERRLLFESGLDVDVTPILPRHLDPEMPPSENARRGMRVLYDRDGRTTKFVDTRRLALTNQIRAALPSTDEFRTLTADYWYHVIWAAKKLRRGETWTALECLNCYMAGRLITLIGWHARALHGQQVNTWFNGRFLERWAVPKSLDLLRGVFATYDHSRIQRALWKALDAHDQIARDVAGALRFDFDEDADAKIRRGLARILGEDGIEPPERDA